MCVGKAQGVAETQPCPLGETADLPCSNLLVESVGNKLREDLKQCLRKWEVCLLLISNHFHVSMVVLTCKVRGERGHVPCQEPICFLCRAQLCESHLSLTCRSDDPILASRLKATTMFPSAATSERSLTRVLQENIQKKAKP